MKKLSALLLVLVLILSLAACGNSPASDDPAAEEDGSANSETPAPSAPDGPAAGVAEDSSAGIEMPAPSASGIWEITTTGEDEVHTITMTIELGENGMGYVREQQVATQGSGFNIYTPLSWTDTAIIVDGRSFSYTWDADSLTVETEEGPFVLTRVGDAEMRVPLTPGTYSLVGWILNGWDLSAEHHKIIVTVDEDGTGISVKGDHSATFTSDAYFFTFDEDGKQVYYTFDGTTLTEYQGSLQLVFTLDG